MFWPLHAIQMYFNPSMKEKCCMGVEGAGSFRCWNLRIRVKGQYFQDLLRRLVNFRFMGHIMYACHTYECGTSAQVTAIILCGKSLAKYPTNKGCMCALMYRYTMDGTSSLCLIRVASSRCGNWGFIADDDESVFP